MTGSRKLLDISLNGQRGSEMSILNTATSGMLANSSWLSNISQNVANANSTGYKNQDTDFSALVDQAGQGSAGAGVTTTTTSLNSLQGQIQSTSTTTDLAVQGAGFFVVSNAAGDTFLTRDGSFVPDASGNLVNSAGYYLMGANTLGATSSTSVNSIAQLQTVNIDGVGESAAPSTSASMVANLDSNATPNAAAVTQTVPQTYTSETTMVAYDTLGNPHTLDMYFTNISTPTTPNTWQLDVYDTATNPGPPYTTPPQTQTLTFDPTTGALSPSTGAGNGSPMTILVGGGALVPPTTSGTNVSLDLSNMTQLAAGFAVSSATINGSAPGTMTGVAISASGVMSFQYSNGSSQNAYQIPLANVPSPDNLTSAPGDAYQTSSASGALQIGNAGSGGLGSIDSSSLEQSTVDLATELTSMVEAQSSYEANSKAFQTGSDILSILNNLSNSGG
jgi:flagellar hook protein FlgE